MLSQVYVKKMKKENFIMKKQLVALGAFLILALGALPSLAACPCQSGLVWPALNKAYPSSIFQPCGCAAPCPCSSSCGSSCGCGCAAPINGCGCNSCASPCNSCCPAAPLIQPCCPAPCAAPCCPAAPIMPCCPKHVNMCD